MATEHDIAVSTASHLADGSYEIAMAIKIDSPQMLAIAGDELRSITGKRKEIEELRLTLTRPLDESKKRIMELFRAPTERLEQAEGMLRLEVVAYQRAEQAKAEALRREQEAKLAAERAEAERARREAEQREREALEAARNAATEAEREAAQAAAAAASAQREEAQAQAEIAEIAPAPLIPEAPKAEGVSMRQTWKAEVTDLRALILAAAERAHRGDDTLLAFLMADTKALAGAARSMRSKLSVPGVRVYAEDGLSVRR